MSLRRRLFAATGAAVLAAVGISLLIGALLTRQAVVQTNIANLGRQADLLAERAAIGGPGFLGRPQLRRTERGRGIRLVYVSVAEAGRRFGAPVAAALGSNRGSQGQAQVAGRSILYAARPVAGRALVLIRPDTIGPRDWRPFLDSFLIAGLVGAALAAIASLFLARRIGGPVARIARATATLAAGRSPEPVPVEGPGEIATLAASFNHMQAELAAAREHERTFLLSVSHELKTPLTAIRGWTEAIRDGAVEPDEGAEVIEGEATRLDRLVRDLLDLARLDQRAFEVERVPIELGEVAREAVHRYGRQAAELGVELRLEERAVAPGTGDTDRAIQVVSNLVENALRATPAGGAVTVAAEPGAVTVTDTGPGLAADDLEHAFERFYLHRRFANGNSLGSGLGLAIVKELTEAMGGEVSAGANPGGGARFVVRLPAA